MDLDQYKAKIIIPRFKLSLWYIVSLLFLETRLPYPSKLKVMLLRFFGANVGRNVVVKPSVKIKYPWNLYIGNNVWIGEKTWFDNLDEIHVGNNCCISQGVYFLTGNHDYRKNSFDFMSSAIYIKEQSWIGAKSVICPGVTIEKWSVLVVGSVLTKSTIENSIYQGNPAQFKSIRYRK